METICKTGLSYKEMEITKAFVDPKGPFTYKLSGGDIRAAFHMHSRNRGGEQSISAALIGPDTEVKGKNIP